MQIQSLSIRSYNHPPPMVRTIHGEKQTTIHARSSSWPVPVFYTLWTQFLLIQQKYFTNIWRHWEWFAKFCKCSVANYFNKFILNAWFPGWGFSKFFWLLYFNFSFQDFPQMHKSIFPQTQKSTMYHIFYQGITIRRKLNAVRIQMLLNHNKANPESLLWNIK